MARLRIGFVEWPEGLTGDDARWGGIEAGLAEMRPDILVTNELPFGCWLADREIFSREDAEASIGAHAVGIARLASLGIPAIISSRPVWNGDRLANEAFVLVGGAVRPLHRKQAFPNEPGWFESQWFTGDGSGFAVAEILGIKVGVLLCTEAMFNERARAYGRQGAALIVIPRASGTGVASWKTAGAMAALVSGAYVVSSNRAGGQFGGHGFAYAPGGALIAETDRAGPMLTIDLDTEATDAAQRDYPCYVADIPLC